MKRRHFNFFPLAILILGLLSCNKDGIFNPKYKIKTITEKQSVFYNGNEMTSFTQIQNWTWNNKLLNSITLTDSSSAFTDNTTFYYENNQLIKIETKANNTTTISKYEYKKGLLTKVISSVFIGEKEVSISVIEVLIRDKSSLMKLKYTLYNNTLTNEPFIKDIGMSLFNINSFVVFPDFAQAINSKNIKNFTDTTIVECLFHYSSNNITKITVTDLKTSETENYYYTYDTYYNPYYECYAKILNQNDCIFACSENNILTSYAESNSTVKTYYTYTYNKDQFPISCISKTVYDPNNPNLFYNKKEIEYIYTK